MPSPVIVKRAPPTGKATKSNGGGESSTKQADLQTVGTAAPNPTLLNSSSVRQKVPPQTRAVSDVWAPGSGSDISDWVCRIVTDHVFNFEAAINRLEQKIEQQDREIKTCQSDFTGAEENIKAFQRKLDAISRHADRGMERANELHELIKERDSSLPRADYQPRLRGSTSFQSVSSKELPLNSLKAATAELRADMARLEEKTREQCEMQEEGGVSMKQLAEVIWELEKNVEEHFAGIIPVLKELSASSRATKLRARLTAGVCLKTCKRGQHRNENMCKFLVADDDEGLEALVRDALPSLIESEEWDGAHSIGQLFVTTSSCMSPEGLGEPLPTGIPGGFPPGRRAAGMPASGRTQACTRSHSLGSQQQPSQFEDDILQFVMTKTSEPEHASSPRFHVRAKQLYKRGWQAMTGH